MNENSTSASERILAGAIQDNDRGLIFGEVLSERFNSDDI
jgi:C-terminal processing protease CtpA/Prc